MSKTKKESANSPLRDLIGFVLLAFSVFTLVALISYSPLDPSFNTKLSNHAAVIHNYGGIVGSYLADIFMQFFGYAAFMLPLVLLGITWAVVFAPTWHGYGVQVLGFTFMLLSFCLILALVEGDARHIPSWGGATGYVIRGISARYFGATGSFLLALAALAGSLVLTVGFTFAKFVENTKSAGYVALALRKKFAPLFTRVANKVDRTVAAEEKKLAKSFEAIRNQSEPAIPEKIKVAGQSFEKDEITGNYDLPTGDVPIVVASKREPVMLMPSFHSSDAEPAEAKKSTAKREPKTYKLPSIDLLEAPDTQELNINRDELLANAQTLERKLKDFGVFGKVVEVQPGPVVTMYEFEPAPGVKVNQVSRLNDDLALALKALSVRITMLPGKSVIGIEVANRNRQIVYLKNIIADQNFGQAPSMLTMALGKDIAGMPFVTDLRKMPHLLVAGATGSGKSVSVNTMILSILYRATPEDVRMILVDPKMLELSLYDNIPHLLLPVVTDPRKAAAAMRWAVAEMERRYRLMADLGVRNIEGYNKKVIKVMEEGMDRSEKEAAEAELPLAATLATHEPTQAEEHTGTIPYLMIVIDELADLMMVSSREVEESIIRLAQMARAAGIHLILATQRPSVDVITGVIKANMPARISFQVASKIDSRTILDSNGAELLLGAGDMLFLPPGTSKLARIHGAFVTDNEVKKVTDFWKEQGRPNYDDTILQIKTAEDAAAQEAESAGGDQDDDLYRQALNIIRVHRVASISLIQRKLRIGYNRAARIVERMEDEGLLAPGEVGKPREVRMSMLDT